MQEKFYKDEREREGNVLRNDEEAHDTMKAAHL